MQTYHNSRILPMSTTRLKPKQGLMSITLGANAVHSWSVRPARMNIPSGLAWIKNLRDSTKEAGLF